MRVLTLKQIAKHFDCHLEDSTVMTGYAVDSRLVKPGNLFFALKGAVSDGHQHLNEVKANGAYAAIVSKDFEGEIEGLQLLPVSDPLDALQTLAKKMIEQSPSRIVAVTGSVGKTSTKEFITTLLKSTYHVFATPGNANSQIGLPLSILNYTTGKEDVLVLEMGMTEKGQISKLIQIAPPEVAILTTVALVHACNFESLQAIAEAKAEIFKHQLTKLGILDQEVSCFESIFSIGQCKKLTVSLSSNQADLYFTDNNLQFLHDKQNHQTVLIDSWQIPGKHNRYNLLLAMAVANYFGITFEAINQTLPFLQLVDKRLQFVERGEILFVNDSYNASEISMKAALEALPTPKENGKKIAVLGSILELGKFSDACHAQVGSYALTIVDKLYCLGKECQPMVDVWKKANKFVKNFDTLEELSACLKQELCPQDVVLLKGSQGKKMWKVLEHF